MAEKDNLKKIGDLLLNNAMYIIIALATPKSSGISEDTMMTVLPSFARFKMSW